MTATQTSVSPSIPPDDPTRSLVIARPDHDTSLPHVSIGGGTYTILLSGKDTAGTFTLIDMFIPAGAGPAPHRHDFEESFILLDGELEFTFRGQKTIARAGETIHVPANAPHRFQNASASPVRMLCLCAPAGQEQFFLDVGIPVPTRTTTPPPLDADAKAAFMAKARALAPKYRTELLAP